MIQIQIDTADAEIIDPGLSMVDPASSFAGVVAKAGANCPFFVPQSRRCLMLRPLQLTSAWSTAVTFRAGDYGAPQGWEDQQIGAEGHWWMHAVAAPAVPIALRYSFPANCGWFVEFRSYALPKSPASPILDFSFGQFFQILLRSDGELVLFDSRCGQSLVAARGNVSSGKDFKNEDVSLAILPYSENKLLIWSPSHGGMVDAAVVPGPTGNITEAGAPAAYTTVKPVSALISISPLLFPSASVAIDSPPIALLRSLTQTPAFTGSLMDQPGGTALSLSAVTPCATGSMVTQFIYQATAAGCGETAEGQGVLGIASPTTSASGDAVFTNGGASLSLFSPFLYSTTLGYARTLGARPLTPQTLTGVLHARLSLSTDRAAKSLTFTVDNPGNVVGIGANWTALKDLQNRRCAAYLTNAALEAGGDVMAVAADPDPDTPLIVANGSRRLYVFDGFTDQPEFVDGVASQVEIRCQGLRKRLRSFIFLEQPVYDGRPVNTVVTDILQRAGFVGPADVASTGLTAEICCIENTMVLPSAMPGDEPLFCPELGATAEEFLQTVINYTGWMLDDLIPAGAARSCWYWMNSRYYADSIYAAQGAPTVERMSLYLNGFGTSAAPLPDSTEPNQSMASLVMLGNPAPQQVLEELIANEILVVGADDQGRILSASARDTGSIENPDAPNYVGEVRPYVLVSQSINTQAAANAVCAVLYANLRQARTHLAFTLPDYFPTLGIGAPLTLAGYWTGQVDGLDADLSNLRVHRTMLSVLRTT